MRLTRPLLAIVSAWTLAGATAFAQSAPPRPGQDARIPIAVADVRGVLARLGQDATTAAGLSTSAFNLPASGYGGAAGAHVYLLRRDAFAIGVGGEAILARASRALTDASGKATGAVIERRLRAVSGQLSLNFGHRAGWSYLTAGMGPTAFESYLAGATPDGLRPNSLNFGGGARWFNVKHLAFTADLRFYATKPALVTPNTAPRVRRNLIVFSAGIAIQ